MGMAAGQARLLSITSRMSDNELRAQIINNNKMRLATESSQVSEAYVNALNQAQMMFTNYDADNNTSYQQLTFNSLTSYNPYNNQYGLVNASGQILVSERDATNFINADGDMEKFLASYGLEQTTTYFDELHKNYSNITYTDENGKEIWKPGQNGIEDEIPVMYTDAIDGTIGYTGSGYSAADLEIMFNGGVDSNDISHSGYDTALYSAVYNNYTSYAGKFDAAYTDFAGTISKNMTNVLESLTGSNNNKLNDISTKLGKIELNEDGTIATNSEVDQNTLNKLLADLKSIITQAGGYASNTAGSYFDDLAEEANNLGQGFSTNPVDSSEISWDAASNTLSISDELKLVKNGSSYDVVMVVFEDDDDDVGTEHNLGSISSGTTKFYIGKDTSGNPTLLSGEPTVYEQCYEFPNGIADLCTDPVPTDAVVNTTSKLTAEEQINAAKDIISELNTSIFTYWDTNKEEFIKVDDGKGNKVESEAHLAYRQAAAEFLVKLYNEGKAADQPKLEIGEMTVKDSDVMSILVKDENGTEYYIELDKITAMASDSASLMKYIDTGIPTKSGNLALDKKAMQDLIDVIVLNNVMNTYGEPKISWIDTSSPTDSYNENGEAKYNWYSNLFTRMQNGFKVLQDGLASSSEWIQFALENGIVTMEQVDSEGNWNGLNYSNCSDITEQTDDKAIALAEAEYNAAMNKIENKDKRYDLELKNIDTEHNSLQTEYDSIKTAIDKNVERTFKMYS